MNTLTFSVIAIVVGARRSGVRATGSTTITCIFAGYTILQFIVLATAWNILGGYCGYVNFGSAAFFALGAYSAPCSCTSSIRCRFRS